MRRAPVALPLVALAAGIAFAACAPSAVDARTVVTIAASDVGAEGKALRTLLAQYAHVRPDVRVVLRATPDGADDRHQLVVQWLNAGAPEPDVLQLDVVWTAELAAAGFLAPLPLDDATAADLFPGARASATYGGTTWAAPWFVDVGMLYWRTDRLAHAPATFAQLAATEAVNGAPPFLWQGARYEGLTCVFLEVLGGMGGAILDPHIATSTSDPAAAVTVDSPAGIRALEVMRSWVGTVSPADVVTAQEEQVRFGFQSGAATLMRNWPYAAPLLNEAGLAGRFDVAPMPVDDTMPGARPTATLGGAVLAVNARSNHADEARALVAFLTAPASLLERARIAGQYPPLRSLYDTSTAEGRALAAALPIDTEIARAIIDGAVPRPVTPLYAELSALLQVHLHRALTGQATPADALHSAAQQMRTLLATRAVTAPEARAPATPLDPPPVRALLGLVVLLLAGAIVVVMRRRRERFGWALALPGLAVMATFATVPLALTVWESLHDRDLRAPARGAPFVGLGGYVDVLTSERFWAAAAHTAVFVALSVSLELVLGLLLALALHRGSTRARLGSGVVRSSVLVPWAMPTVVAGILWRFLFDGPAAPVNAVLVHAGVLDAPLVWLADAVLAWVPLVAADVWKTTPFVALLLLAGLGGIDDDVYEAARMDGAGPLRRLWSITLPLLKPALLVTLVFRTLDAVRVFDLVVVLTGGGPGTATEPLTLLAFGAMLRNLRFGEGAVLSMIVFAITMMLALLYVRLLGRDTAESA